MERTSCHREAFSTICRPWASDLNIQEIGFAEPIRDRGPSFASTGLHPHGALMREQAMGVDLFNWHGIVETVRITSNRHLSRRIWASQHPSRCVVTSCLHFTLLQASSASDQPQVLKRGAFKSDPWKRLNVNRRRHLRLLPPCVYAQASIEWTISSNTRHFSFGTDMALLDVKSS